MQLLDVFADGKYSCRVICLGLAILALAGCRPDPKSEGDRRKKPAVSRPVRVIIVEDKPFAESLQRQWAARTEGELDLAQMSLEQLETVKQLGADIIIYPAACLGTLAHRNLIAVPSKSASEGAEYDQLDVFDLQRNAEIKWGNQPYAFSFGSPQLVLMYRADLFAQLELEPPRSWQEYQTLVDKLGRAELGALAPDDDQPWSPVCEPLAAGWAGKTLLARAASYASHPSQFSVLFDYTTMEPLIAGPPFVRALEELVAANRSAPADAEQITPEIARRNIMTGQVAMAFGWPSHAIAAEEPWKMAEGVEIGFAALPGATSAYDFGEQQWTPHEGQAPTSVPLIGVAGKLGSVTRNARRPREAAEILALLTGKEWSALLSPASTQTTMFRLSHTKNPKLWTDSVLPAAAAVDYADLVTATQSKPLHAASIRIPGWQRYLESLDQAVYAARSGEKSAQDALAETAESWAAITAELGVDSQRDAYTRSLGLEP